MAVLRITSVVAFIFTLCDQHEDDDKMSGFERLPSLRF